jgi:dihydropteroate synthase
MEKLQTLFCAHPDAVSEPFKIRTSSKMKRVKPEIMNQTLAEATAIDQKLSNRFINLDPSGYFVIYVDSSEKLICAKYYTNFIDDHGLACDPQTGKPIPCDGQFSRLPTRLFSGKTAKEICVQIFEQSNHCPVSRLDHAAYLGREFQRAEAAMITGQDYIQD